MRIDNALILKGPCKKHSLRKYRKQEEDILQQQQEMRFVAFKF